MKKLAVVVLLAIAALLVAGLVPVYAHGGGGFHGSIWIGPGWWGPPYYPYYYYPYYAQPPVVIQQQAPVYEYEPQTPSAPAQPYYWYFCPDANAYYPYVKQCPGGWKKVVPTPPSRGRE